MLKKAATGIVLHLWRLLIS